jgi:hypothetical protein
MLYYLLRRGWQRGIQYHGRLAELFPANAGVVSKEKRYIFSMIISFTFICDSQRGIVGVGAFHTLYADKNVDYKKLVWGYLFDIQGKFGVNGRCYFNLNE